MNIVKNLFKGTTTNNLDKEIQQKGFEISQCSEICESCTSKFPKHLKFEGESEGTSLWNTTKPYGMHIIIATGKKIGLMMPLMKMVKKKGYFKI